MWCDKCGTRLGSDEHGLACGWLVLCADCETDVRDAQELEQALAQPSDPHRDAGWLSVTQSRVEPGHPRYRETFGMRPFTQRSWRDVVA